MQHRVGQVARRPIPRRRTTRWIWRICFGMLMLAALVAGTGVGYVYFGSPTFRQVVHDYRRGMWNVDKAFPNQDELYFMVLGRDVDRDRQARVVKTNGRTDTILLVRIDFENGQLIYCLFQETRKSAFQVIEVNTRLMPHMPSVDLSLLLIPSNGSLTSALRSMSLLTTKASAKP